MDSVHCLLPMNKVTVVAVLMTVVVIASHLLLHTEASYGGGGGGVQLFMKTNDKKTNDMILLGKPCSGVPTLFQTGKGKKKQTILMQNNCKKEYPKVLVMPVKEYDSYGSGGYGGYGGDNYGSSYDTSSYGSGHGAMSYDDPLQW